MSAGCPFYAHGFVVRLGLLMNNPGSNQCGLITTAHSPCIMQLQAEVPEWGKCLRNPENNGNGAQLIGGVSDMRQRLETRERFHVAIRDYLMQATVLVWKSQNALTEMNGIDKLDEIASYVKRLSEVVGVLEGYLARWQLMERESLKE